MFKGSSLSEEQREAAVALFEIGWGARAVARRLGVGTKAVLGLYDRWRVRGDTALVTKPGRLYSFEFKLNAVQRYISGENRVTLAKELDLSSPHLITVWAGQYRAQGEDGLRPKPKGRPRKPEPSDKTGRPPIAIKLFGSLALLFGISVGEIFGRIYILTLLPEEVLAWAAPVSFWVVVVMLVALVCAFLWVIYVLSKRQRRWPLQKAASLAPRAVKP